MGKTKIFVCDVALCTPELDVATVLLNDEKEVQMCIPTQCDATKYTGKEVYIEFANGEAQITEVHDAKEKTSTRKDGAMNGEV